MVIQNSEVSMTSKASYTSGMRMTVQSETKPIFNLEDIKYLGDGLQAEETEKSEESQKVGILKTSNDSGHQVRLRTIEYLLRMLLLGRYFTEDSEFGKMLKENLGCDGDEGFSVGVSETQPVFVQSTTVSYERWESQSVAYSSQGTAITADGRKLTFNYSFVMSDSFTEKYESTQMAIRNCIDPLVINLDDNPASIEDQTFFFDLDGDGTEDEIHNLGKGSGFLALDKNEDGFINDGLELFGAKTGDGFSELERFDSDGNGWIDENDPVFTKLRIMTINEDGEQELYGLKESDVGAIYLGRLDTQFANRDTHGETTAIYRKSGIFLHESDGHASSVQHVDFTT